MFKSIWEDLKREYNYGNMVTRLIIVNLISFLVVSILLRLILTATGHFDVLLEYLALSSDWTRYLLRPWTFFTSMFLHVGFFHFLFNMLFLYWFGRIVGDLLGNQRILPLYLLGGLAGALAYIITAGFFYGNNGIAYGASAAVMAVVMAAGVTAPDYRMHLLLLGPVKLKYIVGALILIDLIGIANLDNTGGHIAHLGGTIFGWFFVFQLRQGNDLSVGINRLVDRIGSFFSRTFSGRKRPRVIYRNPKGKTGRRSARGGRSSDSGLSPSYQEQLDAILDKIKDSGYESLTAEEKEFLFNASKK